MIMVTMKETHHVQKDTQRPSDIDTNIDTNKSMHIHMLKSFVQLYSKALCALGPISTQHFPFLLRLPNRGTLCLSLFHTAK